MLVPMQSNILLQNSQITFNPNAALRINMKQVCENNNTLKSKEDENLNEKESAKIEVIPHQNSKPLELFVYPASAMINRNVYNSNYDSNANECIDLTKLKEQELYSKFLQEKKNKMSVSNKSCYVDTSSLLEENKD